MSGRQTITDDDVAHINVGNGVGTSGRTSDRSFPGVIEGRIGRLYGHPCHWNVHCREPDASPVDHDSVARLQPHIAGNDHISRAARLGFVDDAVISIGGYCRGEQIIQLSFQEDAECKQAGHIRDVAGAVCDLITELKGTIAHSFNVVTGEVQLHILGDIRIGSYLNTIGCWLVVDKALNGIAKLRAVIACHQAFHELRAGRTLELVGRQSLFDDL
ncbi:hypothetical protein D3C77_467550 [compost metagenome]